MKLFNSRLDMMAVNSKNLVRNYIENTRVKCDVSLKLTVKIKMGHHQNCVGVFTVRSKGNQ